MSCGVFSSDIDKNIEVTNTSREFVGYKQGDSLDLVLSKIDIAIDKVNERLETIECSCLGDPCGDVQASSGGTTSTATQTSSKRTVNLSTPYTIKTIKSTNTIDLEYDYYDSVNGAGGVSSNRIDIIGNGGKVYYSGRNLRGASNIPYGDYPVIVKLNSDINLDGLTYSVSSSNTLSASENSITDYLMMVDSTTESNKLNTLETQINKINAISIDGNSDLLSILSKLSSDIKTLQSSISDNNAINTINTKLDTIDTELTRLSSEVIRIDSKN